MKSQGSREHSADLPELWLNNDFSFDLPTIDHMNVSRSHNHTVARDAQSTELAKDVDAANLNIQVQELPHEEDRVVNLPPLTAHSAMPELPSSITLGTPEQLQLPSANDQSLLQPQLDFHLPLQ